jgi:hypothetical protein
MALEYFLYDTNFNNTLVDRSETSFSPSPPYGEILYDILIPNTQPLYLYRESGATIILNDQSTIDAYLSATNPPTEGSTVNQGEFTGYTAQTAVDLTYISGVTDQNTSGITGNDNDISYLSGITDTKLDTIAFTGYSATTNTQIEGKVEWQNVWTGGTYQENDMATENNWTMVANKDTTDRPAPQAVGEEFDLYHPIVPSGTSVVAKQIVFGMQYSGATGYWLNGYRVYVTAGNDYEVILIEDPDGARQTTFLNNFTAEVTGWRSFGLVPKPIAGGTGYQVLAIVNEPDPTPVTLTYNYDYIKPNNPLLPQIGEITHANKDLSSLLVNRTDDDLTDHSAFYSGLTVGDFIVISGQQWAIQQISPEITYFDFTIAPARQAILSGVQPVDFETTVASTLTYGVDENYWSGSTTVMGVLGIDTGWQDATLDDSQYGVDILVQEAYLSPDWDFAAYVGGAGGSSSIGTVYWGTIEGGVENQTDLVDYVTGITSTKIDKVTGATDNLAIFLPDGNVRDSGISIDEITGGTGFYFYKDLTSGVTTVSLTNIVYLSGTSEILSPGIWAVDFNAIGGNLSPNKYIGVSFYIDNIIQGVENYFKTNDANVIMPFVITKDLLLTAGTHTFEIRFRNSGGVANIRYGSMRARLVN